MQEVEPIDDQTVFDGVLQPTYRSRIGDPEYPRRAIGVFSYTDMALCALDLGDPEYCFRRFEARRGSLVFHVAAVWNCATSSPKTSYGQAQDGIRHHWDWIRQCPTVILGDFNANASFHGDRWPDLDNLVQQLGLVSAYHHHFNQKFGAESQHTHFHKGNKGHPFHIDYCLLPYTWASRIRKVEIGVYEDWHDVSDHAPLIVDLDLPVP